MTFIKRLTIKQLMNEFREDAEGLFIPYPAKEVKNDFATYGNIDYATFVILPETKEETNGIIN